MKKVFTLLIFTLALLFPALTSAHPGHDHDDGFHEALTIGIVILSVILLFVSMWMADRRRSKDTSGE